MGAGAYNLKIGQGETFTRQFNVTGLDLTGFTARAQVRSVNPSGELIVDFSTATTPIAITTGGGLNRISIALSATETAELSSSRRYIWDLEVESPGGEVTRLLAGSVSVSREVTRE